MILKVICTNAELSSGRLSQGQYYYVTPSVHRARTKDQLTSGYRLVSQEVLNAFRKGGINERDYVRSTTRFQVVPAELCQKYNRINVLYDIEQVLKERGQEI